MSFNRHIKDNAKYILKGNKGRTAGITFIFFAFAGVLSIAEEFIIFFATGRMSYQSDSFEPAELAVSIIFALISFLLMTPLNIGIIRWYCRFTDGEAEPLSEIFSCFESIKRFTRALLLHLNIALRVCAWSAVIYIFPLITLGVSLQIKNQRLMPFPDSYRSSLLLGQIVYVLSILLIITVSVLFMVFVNRYQAAYYLIAGDESISVRQAVKTSIKYMKGFKASVFLFNLSFIGNYLLCVFIIPLFFTIPYHETSLALYYKRIIQLGRGEEDAAQAKEEPGGFNGDTVVHEINAEADTINISEDYKSREKDAEDN